VISDKIQCCDIKGPSGTTKGREFLDYFWNYQVLKKHKKAKVKLSS
jgi:hypothetical protein